VPAGCHTNALIHVGYLQQHWYSIKYFARVLFSIFLIIKKPYNCEIYNAASVQLNIYKFMYYIPTGTWLAGYKISE
jgi:prolipoprotein diacylglyceryltransferase